MYFNTIYIFILIPFISSNIYYFYMNLKDERKEIKGLKY